MDMLGQDVRQLLVSSAHKLDERASQELMDRIGEHIVLKVVNSMLTHISSNDKIGYGIVGGKAPLTMLTTRC